MEHGHAYVSEDQDDQSRTLEMVLQNRRLAFTLEADGNVSWYAVFSNGESVSGTIVHSPRLREILTLFLRNETPEVPPPRG